jgi:FkbM family methyltransferase
MGYLLHVLRTDDLFVDVGANVGAYTILACAALGARGVAFEPVPNTYRRLIENMRINHLGGRVRCLNVGVGREPGRVSFTSQMDTANRVVMSSERSNNLIDVAMCTLDDALKNESPVLMKIDVEGYETAALEGARETLENPTLHSVIMELNGSGARYGYDESQIHKLMYKYGFRSYSYDPLQRRLISLSGGRSPLSDNTIFIRNLTLVTDLVEKSRKVRIFGREF